MLTAGSLIRKGLFARELPPVFTSEPFADLFDKSPATLTGGRFESDCVRHNLARPGGTRRMLRIPNPRSYLELAKELEGQWSALDAHLKSQTLSISRPVVTRTAERAVRPRFSLRDRPARRARLWRGERFVLYTDVSQFYGSIYTHSIPWALHTKAVAKANRRKTDGDRIDAAIRGCSTGQTVGIPVGPDASFVVAEAVLTAVDALVVAELGTLKGFRFYDDYELAFATSGEAEHAQGTLENGLSQYELVVNPFKTRIVELPQPFNATWTHDLSQFPIRVSESPTKISNDTISLFSKAAEVASRVPGALAYALRKSTEIPASAGTWQTFQSLVWNAVSLEPTNMALALDLLAVKSQEAGQPVDKVGAGEVIEAMIAKHAPLRNASEVAWAVWAAISLEVDLGSDSAEALSPIEDDFVALLSMDADSRGRFPASGPDRTIWDALAGAADALAGDHWLLAYEADGHGWLGSSDAALRQDNFFGALRKRGVRFYDPQPQRNPFTGPAAPLPGAPMPDAYF